MSRTDNECRRARRRIMNELYTAVKTNCLSGKRVLVAVSGGIDSTVLFHALSHVRIDPQIQVVIGHVNHGLRGVESDKDEDFVSDLGRKFGADVHVERINPLKEQIGVSSRDRPTLQEASRTLRYRALRKIAERCAAEAITTAHTADDQTETIFLRLLRGAGPDSLAGIPTVSFDGLVLRPFLTVSRSEIQKYAKEEGLLWREDQSNADLRYARNRLRRDWLPGLAAAFNPKLILAVGNFAIAQREDSLWIAEHVRQEVEKRILSTPKGCEIDTRNWGALPKALSMRLARVILERTGRARDATRTHLTRIDNFLAGDQVGTSIELPGPWRLELRRDHAVLLPAGVRSGDEC